MEQCEIVDEGIRTACYTDATMTIHISAQPGEIAPFVVMPGDPLRAEKIAHEYLDGARRVNSVRGMSMYTGDYRGDAVTIAASGMGSGSMGIYSHELFNDYGVERIIRVGTCGAYAPERKLGVIALCQETFYEGEYGRFASGDTGKLFTPSPVLVNDIMLTAQELAVPASPVRVHCTDVFYRQDDTFALAAEYGLDVVEMETAALFINARKFDRQAAALLTVTDNLATGEHVSSEARESGVMKMVEVALGAVRR